VSEEAEMSELEQCFLPVEEAAKEMGVSIQHVYRMVKEGKLHAKKTDEGIRVFVGEVKARYDPTIYGISKGTLKRWLKDMRKYDPHFLKQGSIAVHYYVLAHRLFKPFIYYCLRDSIPRTLREIAEEFVKEYNRYYKDFSVATRPITVEEVKEKVRKALRNMVRRGVVKKIGKRYTLASNCPQDLQPQTGSGDRVYKFTVGEKFKFTPAKADAQQIIEDLKEIRARLNNYILYYQNIAKSSSAGQGLKAPA